MIELLEDMLQGRQPGVALLNCSKDWQKRCRSGVNRVSEDDFCGVLQDHTILSHGFQARSIMDELQSKSMGFLNGG